MNERNNQDEEIIATPCPICLDYLDEPCSTPCGHVFCKQCIALVLFSNSGSELCPFCRSPISASVVKIIRTGKTLLPSPKILGSVYNQQGIPGLAAYHFESEENCYISYASPHCSQWPDLDNGDKRPIRKPFTNVSINEDERIFRGDISWAPTSWTGNVIWSYEMHFSEDYKTISGGYCSLYTDVDKTALSTTQNFGEGLIYERSAFHDRLMLIPDLKIIGGVYVQHDTLGLASYHFESEENCYISYADPQCELWGNLDNGERIPEKMPFTNVSIDDGGRTFKGDIVWSPTAWNGEVLWRYEMCFSDDYGIIISGKVEAFDAVEDGRIVDTDVFGVDLMYARHITNGLYDLVPAMDELEV